MPLTLPHLPQPIKVWEKIGIVVGEEPNFGRYVSRIEDFAPEGIIISPPEFVDGTVRLREGAEVSVFLTRDDAVYRMTCTVTQQMRNGMNVFVLSIPHSVSRVQRRQYVRIDVHERADYAIMIDGWEHRSVGNEFEWIHSVTENISGGGILLQTTELVSTGTMLLLRLPMFERIGLPGTLIGLCRRMTSKERQPLAGLEFLVSTQVRSEFSAEQLERLPAEVTTFDRIAQNKLINYVFQRQIEMRKKGLL